MRKIVLVCWFFLLATLCSVAQWKTNVEKSSVVFKIKNAGITVDGKFTDFTTTLVFDPANLSTAKLTGTLQAKSINTGINARDNHLRKAEYFNVAQYPVLMFTSTSITQKGTDYLAKGNLTIKDVIRAVEIPFTFQNTGSESTFTGKLRIDRRDYHVGGSSWVMGDVVDIILTIKATQTAHMTTN